MSEENTAPVEPEAQVLPAPNVQPESEPNPPLLNPETPDEGDASEPPLAAEGETPDKASQSNEDAPEEPKKRGARERIEQLNIEKRNAQAQAIAAQQEADQLRQQLQRLAEIQQDENASYEDQELARIQTAVKAERLQEKESEQHSAATRAQQQNVDAFWAKVEGSRDRMPDFDAVFNDTPVSPYSAELISASDKAPEIAYWLGSNKHEAHRIANLPPHMQGAEIARVEARLSSAPIARKVSQAPAPSPTLQGASSPGVKDPSEMSMAEYAAWYEKREG